MEQKHIAGKLQLTELHHKVCLCLPGLLEEHGLEQGGNLLEAADAPVGVGVDGRHEGERHADGGNDEQEGGVLHDVGRKRGTTGDTDDEHGGHKDGGHGGHRDGGHGTVDTDGGHADGLHGGDGLGHGGDGLGHGGG